MSTNLTLDLATIWRIVHASSWETLAQSVLRVLEADSFELGFFYGVAEGGLGVIEGLLDLVKMIVLEGIYEKIHSQSWWWHPEDKALDLVLHSHLETAHREFQQLIDELREVVSHPLVFFGNVWDAEVEEYSQKWKRFKELMEKPGIANSFAAGRIAGQTALEVFLLLATVIDGAGLALKGAKALGDLPELLKLVKGVGGKDAKDMLKRLRLKRLRTGGGTVSERVTPRPEPRGEPPAVRPPSEDGPHSPPEPEAEPSTAEKGVIGEYHADKYMKDHGYEKLNGDWTKLTDDPKGPGIDGVYKNANPPPQYVIAEAKYGTSQLGDTKSGKQMSPEWIDQRLDKAVGKRMADEIREADLEPGQVERWVLRVDKSGDVTKRVLKDGEP